MIKRVVMRKHLYLMLALLLIACLLVACADKPASAPETTPTPAATAQPIATTPPENPEQASQSGDESLSEIVVGDWTYYLDENNAVVTDYGEDPPLHRKKTDGSDEDLGIRGFGFDIIGDYIYLDSSYPYMDESGNFAWYTTRMALDGSGQRRLEYGSMSARLIPEGEQKFYFTTARESAVFVSDFSCENVTPLIVTLPDESELGSKLGASRELQLDISDITGGWVSFNVTFFTAAGIQMYKGSYKMAADGTSIEKISGTYYDYESLESALD